jgi:hypothetical protein
VVTVNPLHFALAVGISRYPGGYRELQGPVQDATAFVEWLRNPDGGGVPAGNIETFLSPAGEDMTLRDARPAKQAIDQALWDLRRRALAEVAALPEHERAAARASSRLYIFVAGHGIMPGDGETALLDARAEPDRRTNLELSAYATWFRRDGAFAEVCVFADCCRNFELLAVAAGPDFDHPARLGGPVVVLMGWATTDGALAFEDDGRGYFSRALIDGLEGNAADESGRVTAASLHGYLGTHVAALTAGRPRHQQQAVRMPVEQPMVFGPVHTPGPVRPGSPPPGPGRRPRRVRITFPPGFDDEVELIGPSDMTPFWDASAGPWTIWLHDGLWTVQRAKTAVDTSVFREHGTFTVAGEDVDVALSQ